MLSMNRILKSRPTQKQIAEKLGLSAATVSLALRDNPVVAKSTRELVQQAMRDTGYVRNLAAASLRTGRSNIVGVSLHTVANSFFGDLLVAVERALEASGTVILINNHEGDVEKLDRFISTLATYGADALLVSTPPGTSSAVMDRAGKHGMPVLFLGHYIEGDEESDRVCMDGRAAGAMAARHLIGNGYERLCMVGGQEGASASDARAAGMREAMEEAGLAWRDDTWMPCAADTEAAVAALRDALARDERPTAIVCADDTTSRAACEAVRLAGLVPGDDVGLVGIGSERGRDFTVPPLTMVYGDTQTIGQRGAETVLARLENPDAPPSHIVLDPVMLPGKTSGGPRR